MKILLLGGTGEGRDLANRLSERGVSAIYSLAGVTDRPERVPLPTRCGGFGGADAFRRYLTETQITAVINATHPFAERMSARAAQTCRDLGLPLCRVMRPPWIAQNGDRWFSATNAGEVAGIVPSDARIFLATGRQTIAQFTDFGWQEVYIRVIDAQNAPHPFPRGATLVQRPPFTVEGDLDLLKNYRIDWIVTKNSGGSGGRAKLVAARQLSINVAMIERPAQQGGTEVSSADAAMEWLGQLGR